MPGRKCVVTAGMPRTPSLLSRMFGVSARPLAGMVRVTPRLVTGTVGRIVFALTERVTYP